MIRRLFRWLFRAELKEIERLTQRCEERVKYLESLLKSIDVSVDVNADDRYYERSWAVISIQGERMDFIKFVDLRDAEIREIAKFLRYFERQKIDASPQCSKFLKIMSEKL